MNQKNTGAQYIDGRDTANCTENMQPAPTQNESTQTEMQTQSCEFLPKRLAAAFVIPQMGGDTYEPMEGLKRGTIYPALDIPYTGRFRHGKK